MNPFCLQGGAEPGTARAVLSAYMVTVSFLYPSVTYKYDHFLSALRSESLDRMLLSGLFFGSVLSYPSSSFLLLCGVKVTHC